MVNEFHGPLQSSQGLNWLANCNWTKTFICVLSSTPGCRNSYSAKSVYRKCKKRIASNNKDGGNEKLAWKSGDVFISLSANQGLTAVRARRYGTGFQSALGVFICKETKSKRQSLSLRKPKHKSKHFNLKKSFCNLHATLHCYRVSWGLKQRKMCPSWKEAACCEGVRLSRRGWSNRKKYSVSGLGKPKLRRGCAN